MSDHGLQVAYQVIIEAEGCGFIVGNKYCMCYQSFLSNFFEDFVWCVCLHACTHVCTLCVQVPLESRTWGQSLWRWNPRQL